MQFFKKVIESLFFGRFGGYTECMGITNQSHRGASPNDHLLAPLYECRLIVREGGAAYSNNIAPRTIADTLHKFYEGFDREVLAAPGRPANGALVTVAACAWRPRVGCTTRSDGRLGW